VLYNEKMRKKKVQGGQTGQGNDDGGGDETQTGGLFSQVSKVDNVCSLGRSRGVLRCDNRLSPRLSSRLSRLNRLNRVSLHRHLSRDRLPRVRSQPGLELLELLGERLALVLPLDGVDLLQRLDPDGLAVRAVAGVVVEDVGHGRGAAADDLLEERVVDQVGRRLEAADGAAEELVAVERELADVGRQRLDPGGARLEDGFLLGQDVGGRDLVRVFVEFEPW